uniref:Uncharacterized protein n=1 Tax=Cucumis melo TaxID=3656 RepID=A0A9I9E3L7_CUCME
MKTGSHGFEGSLFRRTTAVRWGLQQPANLTVAASAGIRRTTTKRRDAAACKLSLGPTAGGA